MSFTFDVDRPKMTPNGLPYLEHVNDYVLLANGTQRAYVQHGRVYMNGAEEVDLDQAPAWFWEAYERITPTTRKLVGLPLAQDRQQDLETAAAALLTQLDQLPAELRAKLAQQLLPQAPRMPQVETSPQGETSDQAPASATPTIHPGGPALKTWTCDLCSETIPTTHKGLHMGRHNKAAKRLKDTN